MRAYDLLSDEVKHRIEGLHGFNTFDVSAAQTDVDPHRLLVNEFNTSHFVELDPTSEEGEDLLQTRFAALYDASNVYFHHYEGTTSSFGTTSPSNTPAPPDRPQRAHLPATGHLFPRLVTHSRSKVPP